MGNDLGALLYIEAFVLLKSMFDLVDMSQAMYMMHIKSVCRKHESRQLQAVRVLFGITKGNCLSLQT